MNEQSAVLQVEQAISHWLAAEDQQDRMQNEPDFARWLQESYVPIAGGWQY